MESYMYSVQYCTVLSTRMVVYLVNSGIILIFRLFVSTQSYAPFILVWIVTHELCTMNSEHHCCKRNHVLIVLHRFVERNESLACPLGDYIDISFCHVNTIKCFVTIVEICIRRLVYGVLRMNCVCHNIHACSIIRVGKDIKMQA